jgi:hypothetical protein
MTSRASALLGAAALALVATPAAAQFGGTCDRAMLGDVAGKYVRAQTEGMPLYVPMGNWVTYHENGKLSTMSQGLLSTPLKISWHRVLLDETACRVFLQMTSHEGEKPYVIAVQFDARGGNASGFKVITTTDGDWLFDASYTYEYARREDWPVIPENRRNTREELIAAADAYLDLFSDKTVEVPWGTPCRRLEGSIYTGTGAADDSCNVGVPEGVQMIERQYVVDETIGAVGVFLLMGGNKIPDSHLFRIEDGKIRNIHTVTNCLGNENCGFGPFADMLARNPGMRPEFKD